MFWLLKIFTKRILISIGPNSFKIEKINKGEASVLNEIYLSDIQSYCISFPTDKFIAIKFTLKNGKSVEFSFFQKKKHVEDINTLELINAFHLAINNYNNSIPLQKNIIFQPAFYATNAGLITIASLFTLLVFAILFAGFYQGKTIPVTLVSSLMLLSQLIVKRNNDLKYFKSLS